MAILMLGVGVSAPLTGVLLLGNVLMYRCMLTRWLDHASQWRGIARNGDTFSLITHKGVPVGITVSASTLLTRSLVLLCFDSEQGGDSLCIFADQLSPEDYHGLCVALRLRGSLFAKAPICPERGVID